MVHHEAGLRTILVRAGMKTPDAKRWTKDLIKDYHLLKLPKSEQQMLAYALKLTKTPSAIQKEDIDALRQVGFSDHAIHDICAIVSYFAFVNRIADGLGVDLEVHMKEIE